MHLRSLTIPTLLAFASPGCQSIEPPAIQNWGTIHQALGQGQTQSRVELARVAQPGWWGVGALAGLAGEATIVDGEVWTSSVQGDRPVTHTGRTPTEQATVLFAGKVQRWRSIPVTVDVPPDGFDGYVGAAARNAGLDAERPFPFRIEGALQDLTLHVIDGQCPVRAKMIGEALTRPPFRATHAEIRGQLVGIYAAHGGGTSSHHGRKSHVHAVLTEPSKRYTGHVESVGLRAGAVLFLPIE